MIKNYSINYLKNYFWQGLSILLGFISMFIVTPSLSSNPVIYGVYSICISVTIFLSYADLGFLGSGQKYAAEEYAKGNIEQERKILGFSGFILLVLILVCSLVFIFFSFYPTILIKNLTSSEKQIASTLLLILALFAPFTVLQRISQIIFSIRIEDYAYQRITILGSLVKIASVLFFFRTGCYNIVGYLLFMQIINVAVTLIALFLAYRRFSYNLLSLLGSFHFDLMLFNKTKHLAFNSLFLTFSWILYSECDYFVIGKFLGAEKIAIFAIGLTLMTFLRSLLGSLFSPFMNRFNHFIGQNNSDGLKNSFSQLLSLTIPLVIFPIITVLLLMKPLIFTWVGSRYESSVVIAKFLICCNIFAFITYPTGLLLSSQVRLKEMYLIGAIIPVVYWVGIILTYSCLGLEAFALFKLISFMLSALIYFIIMLQYLKLSVWGFFRKYVLENIPSLVLLFIIMLSIRGFLPLQKGKSDLLIVILTGAVTAGICIAISFVLNPNARNAFSSLKLSFTRNK